MQQKKSLKDLQETSINCFDTQVDIFIHSKRKRLVDPDGISPKAVIDGLVHAGVLADDSPTHIRKVETWSQEKTQAGEDEETIITITEV